MSANKNTFVAKIDLSLADKLREELTSRGFEFTKPPYSVFSAKKKGVSCTLYTSGKLMVQGKEKDELITFYLEPEILKTFEYSHPEVGVDFTPRIGVDETGKGDFFGPLCIAALYANKSQIEKLLEIGVQDSKRLSDPKAHKLAKQIKQICPTHGIVVLHPAKYNELYSKFRNLNKMLAWGHATAILDVHQQSSCKKVIVDQFASEKLVINALKQKKIELDLHQMHRAEADIVVAGASILARSRFLDAIDKLSDQVGITIPKGASSEVIRIGKKILSSHGAEIFNDIAKLHFKTKSQIFN